METSVLYDEWGEKGLAEEEEEEKEDIAVLVFFFFSGLIYNNIMCIMFVLDLNGLKQQ